MNRKFSRRSFHIYVPGSSGNIGPGFDVLGLALNFGNDLKIRVLDLKSGAPIIGITGEGADELPRDSSNIIFKSVKAVFKKVGQTSIPTLELVCHNRIPLARGLGSSSAAILAGLLGGNKILGNPLSNDEILALASHLEGHPDNAAPALLGGIQASAMMGQEVVTERWPSPRGPVVVAIPDFQLSTKKARAVLPKRITLEDGIKNLSSVALMPKAFKERPDLLKYLLNDRWHEPYRAKLIPGFYQVKKAALKAGAYGVTLSGAGPTILSFTSAKSAARVGGAMARAFLQAGVRCRVARFSIDSKGAKVR